MKLCHPYPRGVVEPHDYQEASEVTAAVMEMTMELCTPSLSVSVKVSVRLFITFALYTSVVSIMSSTYFTVFITVTVRTKAKIGLRQYLYVMCYHNRDLPWTSLGSLVPRPHPERRESGPLSTHFLGLIKILSGV